MTINLELWHLLVTVAPLILAIVVGVFKIGERVGRQEAKADELYHAVNANLQSLQELDKVKPDKDVVEKALDGVEREQARQWDAINSKVEKSHCEDLRRTCGTLSTELRRKNGGVR